MHPLTLFLKSAAEAVRASTPPGSPINQVAGGIKQGVALLDGLTADTPARQAQAMAALLSEYAYANSASEKERFALTLGNALMLALEGTQHIQTASQPMQTYSAASTTPPWLQSYQNQSSQFTTELQRLMRKRQEQQRQAEKQLQAQLLQLQQQAAARERELAELKRRLGMLQE